MITVMTALMLGLPPQQLGPNPSYIGVEFERKQKSIILTDVYPGQPGMVAGLQVGDAVTTVNGLLVDVTTFPAAIAALAPGTTAVVGITRQGRYLTANVVTAVRPIPSPPSSRPASNQDLKDGVTRPSDILDPSIYPLTPGYDYYAEYRKRFGLQPR